jgi:hypothetical protein
MQQLSILFKRLIFAKHRLANNRKELKNKSFQTGKVPEFVVYRLGKENQSLTFSLDG